MSSALIVSSKTSGYSFVRNRLRLYYKFLIDRLMAFTIRKNIIVSIHLWARFFFSVSTPFLPGKTEVSEAIHKVASIWLKIAEQEAYG